MVTLVVCGKRHHIRFFPPTNKPGQNRDWWTDNNNNFKPGLVVDDHSIRNPYTFDFYLQSHAALHGTARPCHYFVIHNDMNMSADRLQQITFALCWTFATALTPISYAAPAYYADRLCERGRMYALPMFKARQLPIRVTDAMMLAGMANQATATEVQKNQHALRNILSGAIPHCVWPNANLNHPVDPHTGVTKDRMFYI